MGSEARARLGMWGLLFVALISFNQVYATDEYLGPALLGMLIATGICAGIRRLGFGSTLTIVVSLLAASWYIGLVFQAANTFWSLPTPAAATALVRSVSRALEQSQIDYAPVPLRTGYAVLMVAAMWLTTTVAELATFRWKRPLLASLLPIVLFTVAITTGTGTAAPGLVALFLAALLTYWGLESAHRMRTWGRWVSAWAHVKDAEPESITGELARRLGAAAIACAVVSPLFLPALEDGLLSWRSGIGPGGGSGGGGGRLNPWVSIVPDIPNQTENVLFTVKAPNADYWRISSLELFEGRNWREADLGREPADQGVVIGPAVPISASAPIEQTVTSTGLTGEYLPAALQAQVVTRTGAEGEAAYAGIDYDPDSGAVLLDDELEEGDSYVINSNTPAPGYEEMRRAQPGRQGTIDDLYFQLDTPLSSAAQVLVNKWIDDAEAETPYEELVSIQEEIRRFEYDLQPPAPEGPDLVSDFLTRTQEGFCQQFATAFAVIARHRGYPSRVSVGFLPGERNDTAGLFEVRGTDAHAWPEVFFEEYGWIAFEPTPRGDAFEPQYTQEPVGPSAGGGGNGNNFNPQNPFSDTGAGPQTEVGGGGAGDEALPSIEAGNPREQLLAGDDERVRGTPAWQKTFARLVLYSVVVLILFLLSVPGIKEWRIRKRYAEASNPDSLAAAAFVQFEDEAAELADPRRASESALSYALRLATTQRVAERTALRLAQLYEAASYAATDLSREQAEEARRLARALRSQLWHQASWWARLGRLFSPRRLRSFP